MNGRQHLTFAAASLLETSTLFLQANPTLGDETQALALAGGVLLGSLLPDIDTSSSTLGKIIFPISKLIEKTLCHRGLLHDVRFNAAVVLALAYGYASTRNAFFIGLAFGILTHLVLDATTVSGIPWRGNPFRGCESAYFNYRRRLHVLPRSMWLNTSAHPKRGWIVVVALLIVVKMTTFAIFKVSMT